MAIASIRKTLTLAFLTAWATAFLSGYFIRYPIPGIFSHLLFTAVGLAVFVAAGGYGHAVMNRWEPVSLSRPERFLFATAIGLGLLIMAMILAGVLALWYPVTALLLVGGGLWAGLISWSRRPAQLFFPPDASLSATLAAGITVLGVLLGLLIAWSPIIYYDSLVYHLALPQAYVQNHRWVGMQELIYSAFPQNMEMLWTLGLLLGNDIIANVMGWGVAVLGIIAVILFGQRYLSSTIALWAAAFMSTMPSFLLLSSGGYVDVGLAVFGFLSLYAIFLWFGDASEVSLILAGAFAGIALGIKYTAGISCAVGLFLIIRHAGWLNVSRWGRPVILYVFSTTVVFVPWALKNLIYVGNPVFPFLYRWSILGMNPWVHDAAAGYFSGLTEYAPRSGFGLLTLIWDIAVHGMDFGGGMDVLGNLGWALFLGTLPLLLLAKKQSSPIKTLCIYCLLFFIPWGMSRPVLRFLMPLAPILSLLAAEACNGRGVTNLSRLQRVLTRSFAVCLWVSGIWLFFFVADSLSLFKVPLGLQTRTEYLAKKLPYYMAASFLNSLPADTRTLIVGDQQSYYYNRPVSVTPVFNQNPLALWANQARSADALVQVLRDHQLTHVLVNHHEMERLDKAYHIFTFTPEGRAAWEALLKQKNRRIYSDSTCEILAL